MRRLLRFLRDGLWTVDLSTCGALHRLLLLVLRVALHTLSSLRPNMVGIRASGLALVTLLAFVPLLALVFGIAHGFGFGDLLESWLSDFEAELPSQLVETVRQLRLQVDAISFRALGLAGSLLLVYSGLALFTRIEQALNFTWKTTQRRPWLRRISDFVGLVVLVPVLSIAAVMLSSLLHSGIDELPNWIAWVYAAGLRFVPYLMLSVAFTALFRFMPSAAVGWGPAGVGAVVAATGCLLLHGVYVRSQIGVARFNAIYATLAALPLLLVYLQLVWSVILVGAEVSYAVQNVATLGQRRREPTASAVLHERIGLLLVAEAFERFRAGRGPVPLAEVATRLDLPRQWIDAVASQLETAGVLARVADGEAVLPSQAGERVDIAVVRRALRGVLPVGIQERLALSPEFEIAVERADAAADALLRAQDYG